MSILDLLQRIVNEPPPGLPANGTFPVEFDDLIQQCLLKDPAMRPAPQNLLVSHDSASEDRALLLNLKYSNILS